MIDIRHLSKRFGRKTVIDGMSLAISDSDRIALVGSNGAGKTTLFRCILGHYTYDGSIALGGLPPSRRDTGIMSQIAFVPQLPPPLRMPVHELLNFAVNTVGAGRLRMHEIAARLGIDLGSIEAQQFYRLSGGQKQKVLVTIALAREAKLLIFDEPAANLDPVARAAFIDMLSQKTGCAMLIASHRLEEVAALVNRVIELDGGKVVLDDAVADRLKSGEVFDCRIQLREVHPPFVRAMHEWGFAEMSPLEFAGKVPAAETFRFLSLMSRYAGIVQQLALAGKPQTLQ